jgi:hypothetical protein
MNYQKWLCTFVLMTFLSGMLFAQLSFPIPEETPDLPEDEMVAYFTSTPPTIDADLSEWIYAGATFKFIGRDDGSDVLRGDWLDSADSSIRWSMMWDDDYLYFGAVVWDDIYWPVKNSAFPWEDDCVFLYFDADNDQTVENKMALYLFEDEPTVFYGGGIVDQSVELAIVQTKLDTLGEGGRFIELMVHVDDMTNMFPKEGESFGIQVGIEEGNTADQDDGFKFVCWKGLDPDNGANHLPVTFGGPVSVSQSSPNAAPSAFTLAQNYPNPFNPKTTIAYSIPQQAHIKLTVYDVRGTELSTLVNEEKSAGNYTVTFDASQLNSGVYVYKLTSGNQSVFKKMTYLK